MKTARKLIIALSGIALMVACDTHDHEGEANLSLNEGKKWEVNAEMKPYIERGNALLDAYISDKDTDYMKLASDLKAQNSSLIQSCTMKGESHDELHKWLHPHMELIENLSKVASYEDAQGIMDQLNKSYETFENYFE